MILETPVVISEKTLITERISTDTTTVYTNVDYKPALWAGLAGLLLGLGLGWLFWFKTGETIVAAAASSPASQPGP